ncbi:hypothetical protein AAG570_004261 [Ranatra chinensis]|uniref:Uncharacterized protein n=1 Tax=Ranatra chinensis TaxID=642074 RepID=A0ABD0YFV1_9HEMI
MDSRNRFGPMNPGQETKDHDVVGSNNQGTLPQRKSPSPKKEQLDLSLDNGVINLYTVGEDEDIIPTSQELTDSLLEVSQRNVDGAENEEKEPPQVLSSETETEVMSHSQSKKTNRSLKLPKKSPGKSPNKSFRRTISIDDSSSEDDGRNLPRKGLDANSNISRDKKESRSPEKRTVRHNLSLRRKTAETVNKKEVVEDTGGDVSLENNHNRNSEAGNNAEIDITAQSAHFPPLDLRVNCREQNTRLTRTFPKYEFTFWNKREDSVTVAFVGDSNVETAFLFSLDNSEPSKVLLTATACYLFHRPGHRFMMSYRMSGHRQLEKTAKAAGGEAISFSGRVEPNGSWRKRPKDGESTDRKIGYGTGNRQS